MTQQYRRPLIYPARRAIEHAHSLRGIRPSRMFAVLWPMWRVETSAEVYDEQSYEMIDHMLMRTVAEGGIGSAQEVAAFLGLPGSLVDRCFGYLKTIGHVQSNGDRIAVTVLGQRSVSEGVRYVLKEGRQPVFFEKFTRQPLPRRFYGSATGFLDTPDIETEQAGDGSKFWPLFAASRFEESLVSALEKRHDRNELNLPRQLRDLKFLGYRDVFLPVYLIETVDSGILAYSGASEQSDAFLEAAVREAPLVHHLMLGKAVEEPQALWTSFLAAGNLRGVLSQLPNGVWRVTLAPGLAGGKVPVTSLGSFRHHKNHFIQLWSDDTGLRRQTVIERALGLAQLQDVISRSALMERTESIAELLEVSCPAFSELAEYAKSHGLNSKAAHLEALEPS